MTRVAMPTRNLGSPIPIRFAPETERKIESASNRLGLARQDVIRMACAIGLEHLKAIDYNIAAAVVEKARKRE
jgi:predicted DNA-binding protein